MATKMINICILADLRQGFDDVVNFIPARISAYLMIAAAFIGGRQFDGKNAYRIF